MTQSVPKEHDVDRRPNGTVDHRGLWKVLERFAGTLVDRYELDDVLAELGDEIAEILGAAGAGIMLADDEGRLRLCSTSDPVLAALEELQMELDEGPCLLAYRSGTVVLAADLADDERFTRFGPQAVEAGMAAVYSFPMSLDSQVIGAYNVYGEHPGKFSDDQVEAGEVLADVATSYVINARDIEQKDLLTRQLQHALDSRVLIEQAKGYVTARAGVELTDAFELIRGYSRRNQQQVRMVAQALLRGDLEVDELTQP